MSTTQVDNIIITQEDITGEVGNLLIDYTGPSVDLLMNPVQGYSMSYLDFSWNGTPGNGVDAVSFFYAGGNQVLCRLTINSTYEIPVGGISFPVCISGKTTLIPFSLTTNFAFTGQNISRSGPTLPGAVYTNGDRGSTAQIIDATLTADAGYRFASTSQGSYNISNQVATSTLTSDLFNVIETWGTDSGTGDYTSYRVQADYVFPATNAVFDFNISGTAEAIPVAAPLVISGFSSGDFSSLDWKGGTRTYTLQGVVGSTFNYSLSDGTTTFSSGSGVINSSGYFTFSVEFPQRASTVSKNYSLNITATNTTTLNPVSFGGNTTQNSFTLVQDLQDTVFITRNVTVKNSDEAGGRATAYGWVADGLGFGYTKNEEFIKEEYPMADTLSSPGIFTTITDVFEVPLNTSLSVRIGYTQKDVASPGHYYLQSVVTGMTTGNTTTDVTVAAQSGAEGTLIATVQSPGAGVANAGVLNLYAQDTSF
jgi:hypothetical protein